MLTETGLKITDGYAGVGVAIHYDGVGLLELSRDDVLAQFKRTGFVAFTGFDADMSTFEKFSNGFTTDYMGNAGGGSIRQVINKDGDGTILSVAYNYNPDEGQFGEEQQTFGLPLHADRSYTDSQPPLMWFHCMVPAKTDGQTTVADGVMLYQSLSERSKAVFESAQIDYVRHYPDGVWQLWAGTKDLEKVKAYCQANHISLTITPENGVKTHSLRWAVVTPRWTDQKAFVNSIPIVMWQEDDLKRQESVVRMADGSRIPDDVIADMWDVCNANTHNIPWQSGDLVMVDNTRMMHGRRPFTGSERQISVRMARTVPW